MIKDLENIFKESHSNIKDTFLALENSKDAIITNDKWKDPRVEEEILL
jgi:hypothetical protein